MPAFDSQPTTILAGEGESRLYRSHEGRLSALPGAPDPPPPAVLAHATLRGMVLSPAYPCLGARAAFLHETYRFGWYDRLADPGTTRLLWGDMERFVAEQTTLEAKFSTLVTVFAGPEIGSAEAYVALLWDQLQQVHRLDATRFAWDPTASNDPVHPRFAFSVAGRAFFVAGLFAGSARHARRFPWPALVFNAHFQFTHLRETGKFLAFRDQIRARDQALQGSLNPNLADYGTVSEARQYAGVVLPPDWRCPFVAEGEDKPQDSPGTPVKSEEAEDDAV